MKLEILLNYCKEFWAEFGPFWRNWPNLKKELVWPVPAKMGQIWRIGRK